MSMTNGAPAPLGATIVDGGVNFSVYSSCAEAVELCLFAPDGRERERYFLPARSDGVWHGLLPGCEAGQLYGYRVHGPWDPANGTRCNSQKLLLDPYARLIQGGFTWCDALFDFASLDSPEQVMTASTVDSAPFAAKGVVVKSPQTPPVAVRRRVPWRDTIVYELNVGGYTMQHPRVPQQDRGRFSGMRNKEVLAYLKALGITTVELMPCHAFVDEKFLVERGLRNYWGYNTINFFAPESRYLQDADVGEFRQMIDAIHDANLEVILDVVYNHTAEGGRDGPTLSFRGFDNLAYYRTSPDDPSEYINDSGCGNTLNFDSQLVQNLVLDSMRYWVNEMGVDGFRFDLAPVLGRHATGFNRQHPFFCRLKSDPVLSRIKLVAEPWDVGPGGYQLGNFPSGWAEWNDKFRDTTRRFWRGDEYQTADLARRLHGSSDIFEQRKRKPWASVNFITSHDGYTLADLCSYEKRHNLANGEDNRDGHQHNFSRNYGVEGPSTDEGINSLRRRQRLNMFATLLLSMGTPMILAGDEMGNSQFGNNNAYAQDNEAGWTDWSGLEDDPEFTDLVRKLISLRHSNRLLRSDRYRHGLTKNRFGRPDIEWYKPDGSRFSHDDWLNDRALMLLLVETDTPVDEERRPAATLILFNAAHVAVDFRLPQLHVSGEWCCEFSSSEPGTVGPLDFQLVSCSSACFVYRQSE